jgi:integrase/recombinase XerD
MAFLEVEFNEAGGEPRFSSARFVVAYSVLDITKGPWRSHQPHALFDVESNMAKTNFVAFEVNRYPSVQSCKDACTWFRIQTNLGLARNTLQAYGRALSDFLAFTSKSGASIVAANREHISAWVRDLLSRPNNRSNKAILIDSGVGLSNATLQQRITAVRLFYDFLIEEGMRSTNPVGRGRYTARKGFASKGERGLLPRFHKLPWIPTDAQWTAIVTATLREPLRNRLMLALSCDCALRREELCAIDTKDIDPSSRLIRIPAENTKNRRERVVPFSEGSAQLFAANLRERSGLSRERGALFLSRSRRNTGRPLSIWTWSKVVEGISDRSGVLEFTTHTARHLRLTDLARANWDLHGIATFAGHRNVQTTLLYIHLSGRELAAQLAAGMDQIHAWRLDLLGKDAR